MPPLPHLLSASAYESAAQHEQDVRRLRGGWHCVGSAQDYAAIHDFRTFDVLGTSVIVHHTKLGLRAFVNACAHRHTALTMEPEGHQERLRCPYHGWEYDAEGVACRIPEAACFTPFSHGDFRLEPLRLEALGDLLFVTLDPAAAPLARWLPEGFGARLAAMFAPARALVLSLSMDHPCNWKIPIENVLEDYHVATLHDHFVARHPRLFRFFQGRPRDGVDRYELAPTHTSVRDELGRDSALYRGALAWVRPGAEPSFTHTHVFPNLLLGETGVLGFFQEVLPATSTTSTSLVRIVMDLPPGGALARGAARRAGAALSRALFGQLMREDGRVFPAVQRGKRSAQRTPGRLSTSEVRIHAFHEWLTTNGDG